MRTEGGNFVGFGTDVSFHYTKFSSVVFFLNSLPFYIFVLTEAPGAASVKFNIPKRPYQVQCSPVSNQTFPPGEQPSGLNHTPSSPASAAPGGAQTR